MSIHDNIFSHHRVIKVFDNVVQYDDDDWGRMFTKPIKGECLLDRNAKTLEQIAVDEAIKEVERATVALEAARNALNKQF